MRLTQVTLVAAAVLAASALVASGVVQPQAPSTAAAPAATAAKASAENIVEVAYLLSWDKDPRFRGRDPFQTVLHAVGGTAAKQPARLALPRTPAEELAFADKAASCLKEAQDALNESDFKTVKDKVSTVREMVAFACSSEAAKDKMTEVSKELAAIEASFGKMQARAALSDALQIAAKMQAYFDDERFGEVLGLDEQLQALNTDSGLKNPEVAQTASEILVKCAELKRRTDIRIEFGKKDIKVDAVSYFPEGRSFAIINGEVFGEGALMAPELTVAAVTSGAVTFDYRNEKISQGLAAPKEEGLPKAKRGKEGRTK